MGEMRKNTAQADKAPDVENVERQETPDDAVPVANTAVSEGTAHNMSVSRTLQAARKGESVDKLRNQLRKAQRKLNEAER